MRVSVPVLPTVERLRGPCRDRRRPRPGMLSLVGLVLAVLCGACASPPSRPDVARASEVPPPGVRLLTGAPEGGLPYRLFVSEQATPARPHRLLVWLHPTGSDGLSLVEPLTADLARHGFALLTFPRERADGWSGADANRVMLGVVPEVARVPGVDARRPVLLGFSAGAQMALELWAARPDAFGGLVLVGGSPRASRTSEAAPLSGLAHARVPLLALIGERDGSAPLWREAREPWREAGLALEVREVPGRGHVWLLDDNAEQAAVLAWLDALPLEVLLTGGAGWCGCRRGLTPRRWCGW